MNILAIDAHAADLYAVIRSDLGTAHTQFHILRRQRRAYHPQYLPQLMGLLRLAKKLQCTIVLEDVFAGPNRKTHKILSRVQGEIMLLAHHLDLAVYAAIPSVWQKVVLTDRKSGESTKEASLRLYLEEAPHLSSPNEHVADAFHMTTYAQRKYDELVPMMP